MEWINMMERQMNDTGDQRRGSTVLAAVVWMIIIISAVMFNQYLWSHKGMESMKNQNRSELENKQI